MGRMVRVKKCTADQTGPLSKELAGGYDPTAYSGFQTSPLLQIMGRTVRMEKCTADQTGPLLKELAGGYDPTAYSTRRIGNSQPPALRRKSGY